MKYAEYDDHWCLVMDKSEGQGLPKAILAYFRWKVNAAIARSYTAICKIGDYCYGPALPIDFADHRRVAWIDKAVVQIVAAFETFMATTFG